MVSLFFVSGGGVNLELWLCARVFFAEVESEVFASYENTESMYLVLGLCSVSILC